MNRYSRKILLFLTVLYCHTSLFAGYQLPNYIDGCQSQDGRFVITAKCVEQGKSVHGPNKWEFTWKDNKTGESKTFPAQGVQGGSIYGHLLMSPNGETFALWNHVTLYWPEKSHMHTPKSLTEKVKQPGWEKLEQFNARITIYRKDGSILKALSAHDLLKPEEWETVFPVFNRLQWLIPYDNLNPKETPRPGYAYYRISPDYSILEFQATTSRANRKNPPRIVRVSLPDGRILAEDEKLTDVNKIPVRPYLGPDHLPPGTDWKELYRPSLDPVREKGTFAQLSHNSVAHENPIFQYSVKATNNKGKEITAFMWVPSKATSIRGVLIGGLTLMEAAFSADPTIRKACEGEQLAIVYCYPALGAMFDYANDDSEDRLQQVLDDLAKESGIEEISAAPIFPYGHSVGTIFASHVVCWKPERCFGALLFKGGLRTYPDDANASLAGVPILVVKGQFEEFGPGPGGKLRDFETREVAWKTMCDNIVKQRIENPNLLVSMLAEPGATHFAWSEKVARYTADFITKAAKARIPRESKDSKDKSTSDEPIVCREIKPEEGAFSDSQLENPRHPAAKCSTYQGDKQQTMWHLDEELAQMNNFFHEGMTSKLPQFVTFVNPESNQPLSVGHDLRLRLPLHWVGADTFQIDATFLDRVPAKYPTIDGTITHAVDKPLIRVYGGGVEQVTENTFRVCPDGRQRLRADLLAYHPGNSEYRYAEQQGRLQFPETLTEGKEQHITFELEGSLKSDGRGGLKLKATSDSGLPVRFHVESGPAHIIKGELKARDIPRMAKFPIKVTVVATQYGSAIEPLIQSALPVKKVVLIEK